MNQEKNSLGKIVQEFQIRKNELGNFYLGNLEVRKNKLGKKLIRKNRIRNFRLGKVNQEIQGLGKINQQKFH